MVNTTSARYESVLKRMSLTRPTTTPALFTGARTFSPPMLSNCARTLYAS